MPADSYQAVPGQHGAWFVYKNNLPWVGLAPAHLGCTPEELRDVAGRLAECMTVAARADAFPVGCLVRLNKLHPDDLGDEACPIVPGIIGTVIDEDEDNGPGISVEWQMPFNPVKWTVPADCLTRLVAST